ncbi:ATP-binding cassette domain-containing protein [Methanocrinis sp.]|uniref:ATP-binding cassette domain-containing protein n=1 Tax=Methanocrinis sp. TaxID=3101522 RepID=UPI003D0F39B1
MEGAAIATTGLSMRFNGFVAVDGVDLEIERGELFGLLGPNGAGKSTIIKMLTTMLRPSAGGASVWGFDIDRERDEVRNSIGVVFQDPSVDSQLSGRENLDFHGRMYGMDRKTRLERVAEVLELVDLADKADVLMEDYSGGMQRRLEIARGLMHHPHVLFLDEPTLGLDAQTRRHIWQYILKMNREEGVTVVLTTHYMEEADHLCERVAIIDQGEIVALDTPENLKDLIGADIVTLEVDGGIGDEQVRAFSKFEGVEAVDRSGSTLNLSVDRGEARIPEIVLSACRVGVKIRSVSMHEPTLEDVFLKFTGKKIREAESAGAGRMVAVQSRMRTRRH